MRRLSAVKRSKQDHWRWFLDQLRSLGYERDNIWSFNTKKLGYSSIFLYIDRLLNEHPERLLSNRRAGEQLLYFIDLKRAKHLMQRTRQRRAYVYVKRNGDHH